MFSRNQLAALAATGGVATALFAGLTTSADASKPEAPQSRQSALKIVPFSPADPGATAGLASVPITAALDPVQATDDLKTGSGGRSFAASVAPGGPLSDGVTVDAAVELPREVALTGFSGERRTRVNYRAVAQRGGVKYQVSVLQPSVEDAARGIEGPGDLARVGDRDVYNAYSDIDVSWATSTESNGTLVTVVGGTDPAVRLSVARALGLIQ